MILSHVELWIKLVHSQDPDQHCSHRVLPGVVVLISLGARHIKAESEIVSVKFIYIPQLSNGRG